MTVIRYCLWKHWQRLIDTFYYKARHQTLLLSGWRNDISCVGIIIPTCENLGHVGKKESSLTHQSPVQSWFKFALACSKLQPDSDCYCRAVRKRDWGSRGWGWRPGPSLLPSFTWKFRSDGSGGERWSKVSVWGGKGGVFSHFTADSQSFYLLFYIFSTAVPDGTRTFIKVKERGWKIRVPRQFPTLCSSPRISALCVSPCTQISHEKGSLENLLKKADVSTGVSKHVHCLQPASASEARERQSLG